MRHVGARETLSSLVGEVSFLNNGAESYLIREWNAGNCASWHAVKYFLYSRMEPLMIVEGCFLHF